MSQPTSVAASLTPVSKAWQLKFCLKPTDCVSALPQHQVSRKPSIRPQSRRGVWMKSSVPRIISRAVLFMFQHRRRGCFSWIRALNHLPLFEPEGWWNTRYGLLIYQCGKQSIIRVVAERSAINRPKICLIFAWGCRWNFPSNLSCGEWMLAPLTAIYYGAESRDESILAFICWRRWSKGCIRRIWLRCSQRAEGRTESRFSWYPMSRRFEPFSNSARV